jgi:uncharacterized membrane protein
MYRNEQNNLGMKRELSFSTVFNESWNLFTRTLGLGVLTILIYSIFSGLVGFMIETITGMNVLSQQLVEELQGSSDINYVFERMKSFYIDNSVSFLSSKLLTDFVMLLTFPLAAGFLFVCREVDSKGYANINSLFQGFKPEYWSRLMTLALIYYVVSKIATLFFILPGIYIWVAACLACPFVLFQGMSGVDAFKASISVVNKNWFSVFKLLFVASLIGVLGYFLCLVGRAVTYPLVLVTIYMMYKHLVGIDSDEIDEIGVN